MPKPRVSPICARVSAAERQRWADGLEPGESLSAMVRAAVDREIDRRQEAREVEERSRAEGMPGTIARLDDLLERARSTAS